MENEVRNKSEDTDILDKTYAYKKGFPIRNLEEMNGRVIVSGKPDEQHANSLKQIWWSKSFEGRIVSDIVDTGILELQDRLLSLGGVETCLPNIEEDLKIILERGQVWYGDNVAFKKGEKSQCHNNSAYLWDVNREKVRIATGYALSEDDGIWRQHSWAIWNKPRKNKVVETTNPRVLYYGVVLTEEECLKALACAE